MRKGGRRRQENKQEEKKGELHLNYVFIARKDITRMRVVVEVNRNEISTLQIPHRSYHPLPTTSPIRDLKCFSISRKILLRHGARFPSWFYFFSPGYKADCMCASNIRNYLLERVSHRVKIGGGPERRASKENTIVTSNISYTIRYMNDIRQQ